MVADSIQESVVGIVQTVNDNGFKLKDRRDLGRNGWINISQYAKPAPEVPPEGLMVRVGLDKSGYARTIEPATAADLAAAKAVSGPSQPQESPSTGFDDRNATIARQAVLNTATAILTTRGEPLRFAEVLLAADLLHSWVMGGIPVEEACRFAEARGIDRPKARPPGPPAGGASPTSSPTAGPGPTPAASPATAPATSGSGPTATAASTPPKAASSKAPPAGSSTDRAGTLPDGILAALHRQAQALGMTPAALDEQIIREFDGKLPEELTIDEANRVLAWLAEQRSAKAG